MSTLVSFTQRPSERFKAGARDSWFLVRSPRTLILGLRTRWLVPVLMLCSLVLVPTVVIPTTQFILEKLYPPQEKKLLGLLKYSQKNDKVTLRKEQAAYALWGMSVISVLAGLILYAPVVRSAAESAEDFAWPGLRRPRRGASGGPAALEDRYRIDGEIGSGAMGVVYAAFDRTLERRVALKELPSTFVKNTERRERFRREALTLAKLTHPGIVHIYDLFDDGARMVLVMELVTGGTLEDFIEEHAPLEMPEAARMAAQICETLDHVHRNGIVHRDLKPANILVDEQGSLKVTDFGLARLMWESGLTLDGSLMGTPHYMSPEQAAGKPTDFRSDIYSLGVIFYEMLSGTPPFVGEPAAVLLQQVSEEPILLGELVPELGPAVSDLVMEMLRKNPEERLSDYQEISSRLQALQA